MHVSKSQTITHVLSFVNSSLLYTTKSIQFPQTKRGGAKLSQQSNSVFVVVVSKANTEQLPSKYPLASFYSSGLRPAVQAGLDDTRLPYTWALLGWNLIVSKSAHSWPMGLFHPERNSVFWSRVLVSSESSRVCVCTSLSQFYSLPELSEPCLLVQSFPATWCRNRSTTTVQFCSPAIPFVSSWSVHRKYSSLEWRKGRRASPNWLMALLPFHWKRWLLPTWLSQTKQAPRTCCRTVFTAPAGSQPTSQACFSLG
jgi:hypothetical protein